MVENVSVIIRKTTMNEYIGFAIQSVLNKTSRRNIGN